MSARKRLGEVFEAADLRSGLRVVMEASTKELLLDYVQMGCGVAAVSMSPVKMRRFGVEGSSRLVFHDLSRLFGHENIDLCIRRCRFQPPHEETFCDMLLESGAGA